jgi:hypothetical protein
MIGNRAGLMRRARRMYSPEFNGIDLGGGWIERK